MAAAANIWGIVVTASTLPFVLHGLGRVTFGRWVLLQTFSASTGWLGMLDLGLGTSVTRIIAKCRSTEDREGSGGALGTSLLLFVGMAIVGSIIVVVLCPLLFDAIARIPRGLHQNTDVAVRLLAVQVGVEIIVQGFESCLEGLQRVDLSRGCDILRRTALAGGTALFAARTHRLVPVEAMALGSSVVALACVAVALHSCWPRGVIATPRWNVVRQLVSYAVVVAPFQPLSALARLIDRTVVGAILGPAAVAVVDVVDQIQSGIAAVMAAISYTAVSGAAWLDARKDSARLRMLLLMGTRFTLLCTAPIGLGVAFLAKPGIAVWLGGISVPAAVPAAVAAVAVSIGSVGETAANVLLGTGRAASALKVDLLSAIVNCGLTIALVVRFGIVGAFVATLFGFLVSGPMNLGVASRGLDLHMRDVVCDTVRPLLLPVVAEAVALACVVWLGGGSERVLLAGMLIGGGSFVVVALFTAVRPGEITSILGARKP